MKTVTLAYLLLLLSALSTCSRSHQSIPPEFGILLKRLANAAEFEQVISHYQTRNDTLKLKAVYFLLSNIEQHYTAKTTLLRSDGKEVPFNPYSYPDRTAARAALDSLKTKTPVFINQTKFLDEEKITARYLIENIDLSFQAWQHNEWSKRLDFDQFCQYILPYRVKHEPLTNWRRKFMHNYRWLADSLGNDKPDLLQACVKVNEELKRRLAYDIRCHVQLSSQSVEQTLANQKGDCEDLTTLTACVMRSVGIPVTIDYVPHWAHASNAHLWNALIDESGRTIHFGGGEKSPGEHKLGQDFAPHYRIPKVFRQLFAKQDNALTRFEAKGNNVPTVLSNCHHIDVTRDYVDVATVELSVPESVKSEFAYICVYNNGQWKPVSWSPIDKGKVCFADMGLDVLYIVMCDRQNALVPVSPPFHLDQRGKERFFVPRDSLTPPIRLGYYNRFEDGVIMRIQPKEKYQLYFWSTAEGGWQQVGREQKPGSRTHLTYASAPANALYKVVVTNSLDVSDARIRPFRLDQGQQVFY